MRTKTTHIIDSEKFKIKYYILFTMYSAPIIDLINGYFGKLLPIGQIVRVLLIFVNVYLCVKCMSIEKKKGNYLFFGIIGYVLLQSLIVGLVSKNGNFMININFSMKLILFLSEMQLLINYIGLEIIKKDDFTKFFKFSCWFVPLSLAACKSLNLNTVTTISKAGLYSSTNAMSIIFIIQFVLSFYFSREEKKYYLTTLLSVIGVSLLGGKSPYVYIIFIMFTLVLFDSKHRIGKIIVFIIVATLTYYILSKYFTSTMLEYVSYHTTHLKHNIETNTVWDYIFSGRNNYLKAEWKDFSSGGFIAVSLKLLFGIGRINFATVEMDIFEILFAFGIFVTIGVYYLVTQSLSWNCKQKIDNLYLNLALICMISFSILGGHTFLEAIAATYSAILIGYKYSCYFEGEKNVE